MDLMVPAPRRPNALGNRRDAVDDRDRIIVAGWRGKWQNTLSDHHDKRGVRR